MESNRRQKMANEKIIAMQKYLIPLINSMHAKDEICFKAILAKENESRDYWVPIDEIKGRYLYTYFEENSEWVVMISKKIADDYQKIILEYQRQNPEEFKNTLENGKKWLFGKLFMWGGSIVEEGLLDHSEVEKLAKEFQNIINKRGEDFFGYAHGNVIGDHIYVSEEKNLYLLGMRILPRPGRGYYDFLRALDWLILKTGADFEKIIGWMKQYVTSQDWEEVKLVFALRCIGILGWDMLQRGDFGVGDSKKTREILLKFIRRDY